MLMGFVGLPISIVQYWVMLRWKKEDPFPKGGLLCLVIAAVVSVAVSAVLSFPISILVMLIRSGALADISSFSDLVQTDPDAFSELISDTGASSLTLTLQSIVDMFFSAALLEEGLKYLTCRIAIRRKGMIRTWMDAVIAFAFVGITFELLENIAFGAGEDILNAFLRSLVSAHFVFGVIMGFFYGKALVTGKKRYHLLAFIVPLVYHSLTNGFMASTRLSKVNYILGAASSISFMIAAIAALIIVIRWQKNRTLDVAVPGAAHDPQGQI